MSSDHARRALLRAALCALLLAACHDEPDRPERRARDFVAALITAPEDAEALRRLANDPGANAPGWLQGTELRVAISYLQARSRQGCAWEFQVSESHAAHAHAREVVVTVREPAGGLTPARQQAALRLQLERAPDESWRIARLALNQ